ncbi:MAG TPA: adenine phosphoribosyltransferase [Bacteroidota bacterium]|jgi:adenine phosphoribosyltransferase|nr:adenine phosphoribosyltransferase [Bacteroidota bacterium]
MVRGEDLQKHIRNVPDFPKKGIVFRDITTLLQDRRAFAEAIERLQNHYSRQHIDKIVGIESRGFIFGSVLAYKLHAGFVPIRKPKKLPWKTLREEYQLEYGKDALEIHVDAIAGGERVLIVDDLLATGGTALAACKLVEQLRGSIVGVAFLIELSFLNGRDKLRGHDVFSLVSYDSE